MIAKKTDFENSEYIFERVRYLANVWNLSERSNSGREKVIIFPYKTPQDLASKYFVSLKYIDLL